MTEPVAYAGFWRRAGAHLIDSLIYVPVALAMLYAIYGPEYFAVTPENAATFRGFWDLAINDLLPLALTVWLWHRFGATPGKRLLHCRVVDARTGEGLRFGQAVLRSLGYLVSILPLGLGFLWIIWDPRKQGLHDKIAGTVVLFAPEDEALKSMEQLLKESQ